MFNEACVYATNAINCDNIYSDDACTMIYGSSVMVGTTTERPLLCFMLNGERSEEMKRISISTCPKTCGYCCQTEPFDCNNSPFPRINCALVTSRMCRDPQWREVLIEDCPNVCGFCLEGGCYDKAVDCTTDISICMNVGMQDFVKNYGMDRLVDMSMFLLPFLHTFSWLDNIITVDDKWEYCRKTCGFCRPTATTTPDPEFRGTNPNCVDYNTNCASWSYRGYCTSPFYSYETKFANCAATCSLC
ncbi:hypothetical protein B9Z55_025612 [Caenorhabditis nigoni]|uniref:ShKT domain-containing protein n=1 Tax=Caenorhabditis nigoni TaxID=1611254 RepID=A0A2G5SZJ7_9PELO|nr:hypothetical protein B9Z55_025612 [Caenorhabditis nigoni]